MNKEWDRTKLRLEWVYHEGRLISPYWCPWFGRYRVFPLSQAYINWYEEMEDLYG